MLGYSRRLGMFDTASFHTGYGRYNVSFQCICIPTKYIPTLVSKWDNSTNNRHVDSWDR
jgi:hypothetical protein